MLLEQSVNAFAPQCARSHFFFDFRPLFASFLFLFFRKYQN